MTTGTPVANAHVRQEEPIAPSLPIVDACHHLTARKERNYSFFDFLQDLTTGHNVLATVVVEDSTMFRAKGPPELRPVGETEYYNGAAAMSASGNYGQTEICAGIIGYADLRLGTRVKPVIEAHVAAGGGRFRGIRMSAAIALAAYSSPSGNIPLDRVRAEGTIPPGMLLEPAIREGVACLAKMGLTFDTNLNHPQIPDLVDLARAVPAATIVLNHCGQPLGIGPFTGRTREVFAQWRAHMEVLAKSPNVFVKLGGLRRAGTLPELPKGTRAGSQDIANAWGDYINACIEEFGPDRCMFESNYPSDSGVGDYGVIWNAYKRITANYSDSERNAMFSKTAAHVYRLSIQSA